MAAASRERTSAFLRNRKWASGKHTAKRSPRATRRRTAALGRWAPPATFTVVDAGGLLRDSVRALMDGSRRLLHARRRERLLRRLRRQPPSSLLFVCHANLCRSPYAARVMSRLLPRPLRTAIPIESAGFAAAGRAPPPEAMAVASSRQVDLSSHRSKHLSPAIVLAADLVWVMEPSQRREVCAQYRRSASRVLLLGDLDPDPPPPLTRAIADPFGRSRDFYAATYERIDRCLAQLAKAVAEGASRP